MSSNRKRVLAPRKSFDILALYKSDYYYYYYMADSRMRKKIRYITFIYGGIAEIPVSYKKLGNRNTMVTPDYR